MWGKKTKFKIIGFLIFGVIVGVVTKEYVKYISGGLVVGSSLVVSLSNKDKKE